MVRDGSERVPLMGTKGHAPTPCVDSDPIILHNFATIFGYKGRVVSPTPADAGLLAFRELDEALGLTDRVAELLVERRTGLNTRHTLLAQIRQSVYSRPAGYEDTNDAERLCRDPSIRKVVGERAKEHKAAFTSQMGRFETDVLTRSENLRVLMDLSGTWIDRVSWRKPMKKLILDLDSSVSPTAVKSLTDQHDPSAKGTR